MEPGENFKQHPTNGWFHSSQLQKVVDIIKETSTQEHTRWMNLGIRTKYLQLRVDQRTGDFTILDAHGSQLSLVEIYILFPELKDDHEAN